MTALTQALSSALLHFIWQGVVVAGLLWFTLFALRKRSPNSRYLASCAALVVLAVTPVITMYAAYVSPSAATIGLKIANDVTTAGSYESLQSALLQSGWFNTLQFWILPIWSFGVLLFSLRMIWGCKQVYVLKRRGEPATQSVLDIVEALVRRLKIQRRVRVLMSSLADGPSVVGWLRPVILLPAASVLGLTQQQLEAVLAHELAHIRRHDYFVSSLQAVIETLLFYHPAVWWTSARIRHERELCCDDLAVRACGDAICYARALTKLEKLRVMPSMALGVAHGPLAHRIQRVIGVAIQEQGPSKLSGVFVLLLALAGIAVNVAWARSPQDRPGVTVNLGAATVLHRSVVEYPESAMKQGIQGTVAVEVTLDSAGNVSDARVLSGPPELRKAALQSALDWHFAANVQTTAVVHIAFDLEAAKKRVQETNEMIVKAKALQVKGGDGQKYAWNITAGDEAVLIKKMELAKMERTKAEESQVKEKIATSKLLEGKLVELRKSETVFDRRLSNIRVLGLSEQAQQQLISLLPVRQGEVITRESYRLIDTAIHNFDSHVQVRLVPTENNAVDLQIIAPGFKK